MINNTENKVIDEIELQTTFNCDGLDALCEDAIVENENKEEVIENANENK